MKKKIAGLAILVVLLLLGISTLVLKIQPVNAVSSDFSATVLYSDGYPVEGYWVVVKDIGTGDVVGACYPTNETGQCETTFDPPLSGSTLYIAEAYADYPNGYFEENGFVTDENGNGNVTIQGPYEITPPLVEILSPQNTSYSTSSVSLNFTIVDYSPISWTGYSLDDQPNVTVTGNTTLSSLTWGKTQHNSLWK